jgi:hypothetical protein
MKRLHALLAGVIGRPGRKKALPGLKLNTFAGHCGILMIK